MDEQDPVRWRTLERLKTLDELVDPEDQLREAQTVCFGNARASMILRWLLSKAQNSDGYLRSKSFWDVLTSCLRLIPARRAAVILASNGFVHAIQKACLQPDQSFETLQAIADALNFCFVIGESVDGVAISSVLSMESQEAATFCGSWFRQICDHTSTIVNETTLRPGMAIWSIRKQSDFDDEQFAAKILVPALRALTSSASTEDSSHLKRKKGPSKPEIFSNLFKSLETMIAKHVVLPSRSKFLQRGLELPGSVGEHDLHSVSLRSTFQSLWTCSSSEASWPTEIVETLLQIVVRSVPTPSPKVRLQEQPWIDWVFSTLRDYLTGYSEREMNTKLITMLDVIYRRSLTITPESMSKLVQHCLMSKLDPESSSAWELIAKVCSVDAIICTSPELIGLLFAAIKRDMSRKKRLVRLSGRDGVDYIQQNVLVPIMNAFNQTRNLKTFVALWKGTLEDAYNTEVADLWSDLDKAFSVLVTDDLTPEQCFELFQIHSTQIMEIPTLADQETSSAQIRRLFSCSVIVRTVVHGCQDDDLLLELADDLERLFQHVASLHNSQATQTDLQLEASLLSLLDEVLQKWFPIWISKVRDEATIAQRVETIFASMSFKMNTDSRNATSAETSRTARNTLAARRNLFITLYGAFWPLQEKYGSRELSVFTDVPFPDLQVLASQECSSHLPENACKTLLALALATVSNESNPERRQRFVDEIQAAIVAAASIDRVVFIGEVIATTTKLLNQKSLTVGQLAARSALVSVLFAVPPSMFSDMQRRLLIETLFRLPLSSALKTEHHSLQQCLSLLLKLVETSPSAALLEVDGTHLWHFVSGVVQASHDNVAENEIQPFTCCLLLECIAKAIFSSWIRYQDQEQSRTAIFDLLTRVRRHILETEGIYILTSGDLIMIKSAIEFLQTRPNGNMVTHLVHHDQEVISRHLKILSNTIEQSVLSPGSAEYANEIKAADTRQLDTLLMAFEAIVGLPDRALAILTSDGKETLTRVVQLAVRCIGNLAGTEVTPHRFMDAQSRQSQRLLVCCYEIICHHAPGEPQRFLSLTSTLLEQAQTVQAHVTILTAFGRVCKKQDISWKKGLTEHIFAQHNATSQARLLLQRTAILELVDKNTLVELGISGPKLLSDQIDSLRNCDDSGTSHITLRSLALFLKEKPFMLNQHSVGQILGALQQILPPNSSFSVVFEDICQVLAVLLTQHRPRLQGQFHLLNVILQDLFSSVFRESSVPGNWRKCTLFGHTNSLAKLVMLYCDPPHVRFSRRSSELVDEARYAQGQAGQYAQYILHHFCNQVLLNTPGEGLRDALMPAIMAVIDSMQVNSADSTKILSSAMNNGERAVLRSIYDEWKTRKWDGTS